VPPGVNCPETDFAPERVAGESTVVVAVLLSLPGLGSGVVEDTVAVLEIIAPAVSAGDVATVNVKTALPLTNSAFEHKTVPPLPTGGLRQDQLPGEAIETNVVFAGKASERLAAGSLGPTLFTVIV
jgi:hypothetical protein